MKSDTGPTFFLVYQTILYDVYIVLCREGHVFCLVLDSIVKDVIVSKLQQLILERTHIH